jgi:hypothetical protein
MFCSFLSPCSYNTLSLSLILSHTYARALYVIITAAFLYPLNIPFLHVSTNGFLGYVRLAVQELRICENHAENDRADLYVTPAQVRPRV